MQNKYREMFTHDLAGIRTVFPVVHVTNAHQAIRQTRIAEDAGADGVFLIGHSMPWMDVLAIQAMVRLDKPMFFVGVNLLDLNPISARKSVSRFVDAVWSDDWDILMPNNPVHNTDALVFGSVAFKYQAQPQDPAAAAVAASKHVDVVVTSGSGTGSAPDVAKIKTMKEALGTFPLAIASGITPDNVSQFLPYADSFMVATGISTGFDELDPQLTARLVQIVKAYKPA